jgi:MFS family permease
LRAAERPPVILLGTSSWVQAAGIAGFVAGGAFWSWMAGATLLGLGTALVYPTLLAAVSDVARPDWRASALGVYRLWRDSGYAVGAIAAGLLAEAFAVPAAITAIAVLTFASGLVVAGVMSETRPGGRRPPALANCRPRRWAPRMGPSGERGESLGLGRGRPFAPVGFCAHIVYYSTQ